MMKSVFIIRIYSNLFEFLIHQKFFANMYIYRFHVIFIPYNYMKIVRIKFSNCNKCHIL